MAANPAVRDSALEDVAQWWLSQRGSITRFGVVLRQAVDEVLDGERTGRFLYEDLTEVEKRYLGAKVEIVLRAEFGLPRGPEPKRLDFAICDHTVDCKFSSSNSWMIPTEAIDELCLLITASEVTSSFSVGLLRCSLGVLGAPNQDKKRGIPKRGLRQVLWLWRDEPMPPNLLRGLPVETRSAIFAKAGKGNGQWRINELFRRVHAQVIRREVVMTVAQQKNSMKRPRDARKQLRPEGIIILGHWKSHSRIALGLGLPVPRSGEFVATRLVAATPARLAQGRDAVSIGGGSWVQAEVDDRIESGPAKY